MGGGGKNPTTLRSLSFPFYRYGQRQWKNKEDCWGILEFFCDLTNETSEIQEPYYGRVRTTSAGIHSGWTMTQRFTPWWESEFHGVSLYLLFLPLSSPTEQAVCFAELYGIISFDLILRTTVEDGFYCPYFIAHEIKALRLPWLARCPGLHNAGQDSHSAASGCRSHKLACCQTAIS